MQAVTPATERERCAALMDALARDAKDRCVSLAARGFASEAKDAAIASGVYESAAAGIRAMLDIDATPSNVEASQ